MAKDELDVLLEQCEAEQNVILFVESANRGDMESRRIIVELLKHFRQDNLLLYFHMKYLIVKSQLEIEREKRT